ncbi:MAG TPA: alkaline phosphatase family protein [Gemmatimonadaceae bacterium]|nr:alkaline phosphatase family protein [Gemmatimonadaceae bacterium]
MQSPRVERRRTPRASPLLRWYYALKYRAFARERRPRDERRGVVMLQIDALAYADLRRAMKLGYCPTLSRMLRDDGHQLRRWFCGLPSATPYCQAGIFHGENDGIPAFRFYDKAARRVVTCNAPDGVQYIRDRIHAPGALAGGSSYVNLLDGDASTVAFTVATRQRMSVYHKLGGTRMALLMLLHPIRMIRMLLQSVWEWLREEWERAAATVRGRVTHSEGVFPLVRILSNVVVRELQTLAILLDVYLGVPVIYSTFMQYDELGHHFGPSSRQALGDLKRTDARIGEIRRMVRAVSSRRYDVVVLSDHGMTPARSYRVAFGESLGATVQKILDESPEGGSAYETLQSQVEESEYADLPAQLLETMEDAAAVKNVRARSAFARVKDWLRSRYGIREIILPEKYRVDTTHNVVVTYSSCLALVYFADVDEPLRLDAIARDARRSHLYKALRRHPGIGLVATRLGPEVLVESRVGRARLTRSTMEVVAGSNPLEPYGTEPYAVRAIFDLVSQPNSGDIVLFGAYDGYDIVSFDDQVGAHGSAGGDQMYPFILAPRELDLAGERLEDARDIHRAVLSRYAVPRDDNVRVASAEERGRSA